MTCFKQNSGTSADHFSDHFSDHISNDISDHLSDHLSDRFSDHISNHISDHILGDLSDHLSGRFSDHLSDHFFSHLLDDISTHHMVIARCAPDLSRGEGCGDSPACSCVWLCRPAAPGMPRSFLDGQRSTEQRGWLHSRRCRWKVSLAWMTASQRQLTCCITTDLGAYRHNSCIK